VYGVCIGCAFHTEISDSFEKYKSVPPEINYGKNIGNFDTK
jgi:hypothetical protein